MDKKGNEISDDRSMAINYMKTSFIIDCLATIPFDLVLSASSSYREYKVNIKKTNSIPWVDLLGVLKLGRLLRLSNIIYFLKASGDVKSSLKIMKLCLFLMIYWHCFACNWWFMVKTDKLWIPVLDQPSGKYKNIYDAPMSLQYLYSLQVSVWTLTGCDVQPRTMPQTFILSLGLFLGAVIDANIIVEVAIIMSEINRAD